MADKVNNEKRIEKSGKQKANAIQKATAFVVKIFKKLKSFFANLKAELKRVIWPDRKRLIQSTATVLAICLIIGLILFLIDGFLQVTLNAAGFYNPNTTVPTTAATTTTATTAGTTVAGETTTAAAGETTSATSAETTVATTESAAG